MKVQEKEKDEREFEQQLNEIYGTVTICGMEFDQGTALKELDPTAFRCALSDEPITYVCGECSKEYEDEEEAEACCTPECSECGKTSEPLHTDGKCRDCHIEAEGPEDNS